MKVSELIEILSRCNPDLPVAVHALNHTYMSGIDARAHGDLRIANLATYGGDHVVIGNMSKRAINPPNWFITEELDGGREIPLEWRL